MALLSGNNVRWSLLFRPSQAEIYITGCQTALYEDPKI